MLLPEAIWNSLVSDSTEDRHCELQHSLAPLSLCGLSLRGRAVVAPRRFHFTITALTVTGADLAGQKFHKLTFGRGGLL